MLYRKEITIMFFFNKEAKKAMEIMGIMSVYNMTKEDATMVYGMKERTKMSLPYCVKTVKTMMGYEVDDSLPTRGEEK